MEHLCVKFGELVASVFGILCRKPCRQTAVKTLSPPLPSVWVINDCHNKAIATVKYMHMDHLYCPETLLTSTIFIQLRSVFYAALPALQSAEFCHVVRSQKSSFILNFIHFLVERIHVTEGFV